MVRCGGWDSRSLDSGAHRPGLWPSSAQAVWLHRHLRASRMSLPVSGTHTHCTALWGQHNQKRHWGPQCTQENHFNLWKTKFCWFHRDLKIPFSQLLSRTWKGLPVSDSGKEHLLVIVLTGLGLGFWDHRGHCTLGRCRASSPQRWLFLPLWMGTVRVCDGPTSHHCGKVGVHV